MPVTPTLACFAVTPPGVEAITAAELGSLGLTPGATEPGGVSFSATAAGLYGANLSLCTANRVLVRLAEFMARAFYELERKAKRVPWETVVASGAAVRFRVTSRKSRLYHVAGIAERLYNCVNGQQSTVNGTSPAGEDEDEGPAADPTAQLFVVRVLRDVVTISADSSGALLHRRGYRLPPAAAAPPGTRRRAAARRSVRRLGDDPDRGGAPRAADRAGAPAGLRVRAVAVVRRRSVAGGEGGGRSAGAGARPGADRRERPRRGRQDRKSARLNC